MQFQAIKGVRDFYPGEMQARNHIFRGWREVALRNGFVEYDGPMLEYLDLFKAKSGEEIVEQLFHLTDRGGRELALRPEMTPTLARMINAKVNSLARPIKWFSVPRLCRAERPQRGRLREFFQWNIDVVGVDDPLADAEAIFVAVDLFRWFGLRPEQVVVKVNSRRLMAHMLLDLGASEDQLPPLYALLDRRDRLAREKYEQTLVQTLPDASVRSAMGEYFGVATLAEIRGARSWNAETIASLDELESVFNWLDRWGIGPYCAFDMSVVRGLAYYTGVVFEAYGKGGLKRAVCGGGRYDDLLQVLGGPKLSGVGFATSDVVIQDLLAEFGLLPETATRRLDVFVIDAAPEFFEQVIRIVGELRGHGVKTEFAYRRQPLGKQLKAASAAGCKSAVILGQETRERGAVALKNLVTGEQKEVRLDELLADPHANLELGDGA